MALVNPATVQTLLHQKDSRWLQLEVCREFQRGKCTRPDSECKYAHPPPNVEVTNGRVTACYDSIKARCTRENPPCKYYHPSQPQKDQLLITGRNHLAMKNAMLQAFTNQPGLPGLATMAASPYQLQPGYSQLPGVMYPYSGTIPVLPMGHQLADTVPSQFSIIQQPVIQPQKLQTRTDRLEPLYGFNFLGHQERKKCTALDVPNSAPGSFSLDPRCFFYRGSFSLDSRSFFYMGNNSKAIQGVPYKRPAGDKSGIPVYQPSSIALQTGVPSQPQVAYQQALMSLQQQPPYLPMSFTGHPPSVQRF